MAGSAERQMVLKMLQEGRIGADEAEELLAALERAQRPGQPETEEREEPERPADQPELDFGEIGRGIREAVRGLTEGLQKLTEKVPWGRDLGEWFRTALGGSKATVERAIVCPAEAVVDRVAVKASNGKVTVRGAQGGRPTGKARVTAWGADDASARRLAEEVRVFTTVREGLLEISYGAAGSGDEGAPPPRFEVDLELQVPDGVSLDATTTSGDLVLEDLAGELALETASGSVRLGAIRGRATVTTSSGSVRGEQRGADRLEVRTSSGDVALTLAPSTGASARITTASGDVVLRLESTARVRVEATTSSGEVVVRAPLRVEELGRSRFVGVQGEADGEIRLSSSSGNLRIETPSS